MNRINKYKVWDVGNKGWLSPKEFSKLAFALYPDESAFSFEDGAWKFLQFTNFRDKNEKEIFEGDIIVVKVTDKNSLSESEYKSEEFVSNGFLIKRYVVTYDTIFNNYQLMNGDDKYFVLNKLYCAENCEVVGNVCENPDLL